MANERVRDAAKAAGVCLWQVALAAGVAEGTFSRKLRLELPAAEQAKLIEIIQRIGEAGHEPANGS